MAFGYIYVIRNTVNEKLYVGKTVSSLEERMRGHCWDCRRDACAKRPLYRAMRKYGTDKFSIHLLEKVAIEILSEREIYWIDFLDSYKSGYNATRGGDGALIYDVNLFVHDYNEGMTVRDIAKKYHCSEDCVSERLRAENIDTWKNAVINKGRPVKQYDKNGNYIQTFQSQKDAARYLIANGYANGLVSTLAANIGRVVRGKVKTCLGYVWKAA